MPESWGAEMRMPVEMLVPSPVLFFWPQSLAPPLAAEGNGSKETHNITLLADESAKESANVSLWELEHRSAVVPYTEGDHVTFHPC